MCWTAPVVPRHNGRTLPLGGTCPANPFEPLSSLSSSPWSASARPCQPAPVPRRTPRRHASRAPGEPVQAVPAWLVRPRPHPAHHEEGCRARVVPQRLLPARIALHAEAEQRAHQRPRASGCARPRHRDPHRPRRLPLPRRACRINRTSGDQAPRVSRLGAEVDVLRRQRTRGHLRRLSGAPQRTQTAVSTGSVPSSPSGPEDSSTDPGGSNAGSMPVLTSTVTSPRR